ncbi:MAG: hypothetical protein SNJ82_00600 [Gemmataceae bacterium]
MAIPRIMVGVASLSVAFALLAAPAQAAAPPKVSQETELSPHFLPSAAAEALSVLVSTQLLSPRALIKKTPPPVSPPPMVVRPPEPPPPPPPVDPRDPPPVLTEVPEPGTMLTALVGGSLAVWTVYRRRRSQDSTSAEPTHPD